MGVVALVWSCTIAVFSGEATEEGRPMLWKNRDVHNASQQYIYVEGGEHRFVGITYQGTYDKVYGGVNDAGFGIVNTDTYNQGPWRTTGATDGEVMFWALERCETVWDFMELLDSLICSDGCLRSTHCYGVIDGFGNAGVVEASCTSFVYFSAVGVPSGFLVRTNFAVTGADDNRRGFERYLRARAILEERLPVSYKDILAAAGDLATTELDPYPLPFEGTYDGLPYGYISTANTINRYFTTSYQVICGMREGDEPLYPYMLCGFGQPCATIPVAVWVSSGEVPEQTSGTGNILCEQAQFIHSMLYDTPQLDWLNTFAVYRIDEFLSPRREELFTAFDTLMLRWLKSGVSVDTLAMVQELFAAEVADAYEDLHGLLVDEGEASKPTSLEIKAAPNPFNEAVTIELEGAFSTATVKITDLSGRPVFSTEVTQHSACIVWHPEGTLPAGAYLITASDGRRTSTKTVVFVK